MWPGHDSSGPNLSVRAMCESLGDEFDFALLGRDRPPGASRAVIDTAWHPAAKGRIRHLTPGPLGARNLAGTIRSERPDLIMLNGFHDREITIPTLVLRKVGRLGDAPVLLSPRGEFSSGARGLGALRKRVYLSAAKTGGLMDGVVFHATSDAECADLAAVFPGHPIEQISNIRSLFPLPTFKKASPDAALRLFFLGRISPVKGLDVALRALAQVSRPAELSIYGPVHDEAHWRECQRLIAALPDHVVVRHQGEVPNDAVAAIAASHDLMLLPSRSENFGHAIFESLAAGTPVLIGRETPWRGLEADQAGYDIPLADTDNITRAIDRYAAMNDASRETWRSGARRRAEEHVASSTAADAMRRLIRRMARPGSGE